MRLITPDSDREISPEQPFRALCSCSAANESIMRTGSIPVSASFRALRSAQSSSVRRVHGHASPMPRLLLRQSCKLFNPSLLAGHQHAKRTLFTETLPTVLIPPAIFLSCFVGLWSYKIIMTIVFQNKFIYMPYMPPFARSEKIDDYAAACRPVQWEEKRIRSLDGTRISLCLGSPPPQDTKSREALETTRRRVVVIYFQGCVQPLSRVTEE